MAISIEMMTAPNSPEIIASNKDYKIALHRAAKRSHTRSNDRYPDPVVVTFGGQPSDLGDSGFGTGYALQNGWDNIYVAQRHGTQYQGLPIEAFRNLISPYIKGRDVVCYGSSLGAYAALYYGGSINARIVAAAPMFPAWPPLKNTGYQELSLTHRELSEAPYTSRSVTVIYDPKSARDAFLLQTMVDPVYPKLRRVDVPYGGHTVLVTLAHDNKLNGLIYNLIANDLAGDFIPPGEGTAVFHGERGKALRINNSTAAASELERSVSIRPIIGYYTAWIEAMVHVGNVDRAIHEINIGLKSGDREKRLTPKIEMLLKKALDAKSRS